jgi:hypothetical protein
MASGRSGRCCADRAKGPLIFVVQEAYSV